MISLHINIKQGICLEEYLTRLILFKFAGDPVAITQIKRIIFLRLKDEAQRTPYGYETNQALHLVKTNPPTNILKAIYPILEINLKIGVKYVTISPYRIRQ